MINNRQAGRRRGRNGNPGGNGNGGGGGGQRTGGGQGRPDNGNRIDNRSRGNANQLYEKYKNLAADAHRQGDRVNIEYYLQFADHYFRVLSDQRNRFEEQQPQQQQAPRRNQPDFDIEGIDDDYGDEGEPIRAGEQGEALRNDRTDNRQDGNRQDGNRSEGRQEGRNDRPQRRTEGRQDGNRQDGNRQDGDRQPRRWDNGDEGGDEASAGERQPRRQDQDARPQPRQDGRADGARAERPARRWDNREAPRGEGEQAMTQPRFESVRPEAPRPEVQQDEPVARSEGHEVRPETVAQDADVPAPRKRGRPRRDAAAPVPAEGAPVAGETNGVDADRLPPSLGVSVTPANDSDGDEPRPRRRRVRAVVATETAND